MDKQTPRLNEILHAPFLACSQARDFDCLHSCITTWSLILTHCLDFECLLYTTAGPSRFYIHPSYLQEGISVGIVGIGGLGTAAIKV